MLDPGNHAFGDRQLVPAIGKAVHGHLIPDIRKLAQRQGFNSGEERLILDFEQGQIAFVVEIFDFCGEFFGFASASHMDENGIADNMRAGQDPVASDDKAGAVGGMPPEILPGLSYNFV